MKMNKGLKRMLPIALGAMIMISGVTPAFAADKVECEMTYPTFKEYVEGVKDIKDADMKSLEKLYNEATALEKSEKYDESDKKWDAFDKIFEKYVDESDFDEADFEDIDENYEIETFKELMDYFKDAKISDADMKSLEQLYNEGLELEKNEKYDELDKKWDDFEKILEKYVDESDFEDIDENYEPETFKEFMDYFKDAKISDADMKSLEKLYNEAAELEKNEKYDESDKKWDAFDKILEKYVDESDMESGDCEDGQS